MSLYTISQGFADGRTCWVVHDLLRRQRRLFPTLLAAENFVTRGDAPVEDEAS